MKVNEFKYLGKNQQFCAFLVFLVFFFSSITSAFAQSLVIEDFESGHRVSCNSESAPNKYFYNHYDGVGGGYEEVTTNEFYSGTHSFKETVTAAVGKSNFQFRPVECDGNKDYMREHVLSPNAWQLDTYNRLRFWIKVPPGVTKSGSGNDNMHFGTYTRSTSYTVRDYESSGGHWYHHYNIGHTGEWHQVIVDWHPNSKRGVSGSTEHGEKEYPTNENGYNYFDLLTRFYVQVFDDFSSDRPIYFDNFEVYRETRPENVDQVYSVNGVYVPSTNEIVVGWNRDKDENDAIHEVRYSFQDIHQLGFENATFAANATALGHQGYNGMEWSSSSVDTTGRSVIYVAIKPTNSNLFRQIEIPISGSTITPGMCVAAHDI